LLTTWSAAHDVVLADPDEACEILWGTLCGNASLSYLGNVGNDRERHAVSHGSARRPLPGALPTVEPRH
jgi:hypothetical protein